MKGFKLSLFLFIIWWSLVTSSIDKNNVHSALELKTIHQETIITEIDLNEDEHTISMTSDIVNYSQEFVYTEDVQKICDGQVNEFVCKCPTTSDGEEIILKFRTIFDQIHSSILLWYLKSINGIDIVEMDPTYFMHQIQFFVKRDQHTINLSRLYPTYPEISGFEILQFITNLAFQCKFSIDVFDGSDISKVYFPLYGKSYYEYHFEGIDVSQNFLFKKIVVKKKTFLDCFEKKIKCSIKTLSQLFYENIQICENAFVSVEFCPIIFETQYIFYNNSFQDCIDWSLIGGFPQQTHSLSQRFEILLENTTRIMEKKKQSHLNVFKINRKLVKTYDEIKTQIVDTSFLMKLFSNIFELCFFELEKRKSRPNPEDIFKFYLRPCVIPNTNLLLKYYTDI